MCDHRACAINCTSAWLQPAASSARVRRLPARSRYRGIHDCSPVMPLPPGGRNLQPPRHATGDFRRDPASVSFMTVCLSCRSHLAVHIAGASLRARVPEGTCRPLSGRPSRCFTIPVLCNRLPARCNWFPDNNSGFPVSIPCSGDRDATEAAAEPRGKIGFFRCQYRRAAGGVGFCGALGGGALSGQVAPRRAIDLHGGKGESHRCAGLSRSMRSDCFGPAPSRLEE